MIFQPTPVAGASVVKLEAMVDERGFFARAWCADVFAAHGLDPRASQINVSLTRRRGTIRGLHRQADPHAEGKLVRCIRGRVFDVCVDVRPESPTFGGWFGVELSMENRDSFFIPPGCAHGFQTLTDDVEMIYLMTAPYVPGTEQGFRWDDPFFGIDWPVTDDLSMSDKDASWPDYRR